MRQTTEQRLVPRGLPKKLEVQGVVDEKLQRTLEERVARPFR